MYLRKKFLLALLVGSGLSACAVNPTKHKSFDDSIAQRALELNDAYYAELNGQILKNILRARDRQPRFYTSMSDISTTPHSRRTDSAGLSGINTGNPTSPWAILGLGTTAEKYNQLKLTVSPKATKEAGGQPIYHAPLGAGTFLNYYNDWDREIVDNLLIDNVKRIAPGITSGGQDVISAILDDSDGHFQVILSPEFTSVHGGGDCSITQDCQTIDAYYCFDTKDCQAETVGDTVSYNLSERRFSTIRSYGENLNRKRGKKINTRENGALFLCKLSQVEIHSNLQPGFTRDQGKPASFFDCQLASAASVDQSMTQASLIYVGNLGREFEGNGMYFFSTSSIDNMIYKVGSSLRENGKTWVSKIKVDHEEKDFFAVYDSDGDNCHGAYAARVKHNGDTYMAGPPEAKGSLQGVCHANDSSGTVLTLIGEIIKLKEVNAELQASSFLINN